MTSDTSFDHIISKAEQDYLNCQDLPFAVFLTSLDGVFLRYNTECQSFFSLADQPNFTTNLCEFYLYISERSDHIKKLYQLPKGDWLRNTTLDLDINGEIRHVRDHSKAIWDESGERIIGLLCLVIPISKGDRYTPLFTGGSNRTLQG